VRKKKQDFTGDVRPDRAAERLGLSLEDFESMLPSLFARGFPKPDPSTLNYDAEAIDTWRRFRHPHLYQGLEITGLNSETVAPARIAAMRKSKNAAD
jgi:hypothetical protein